MIRLVAPGERSEAAAGPAAGPGAGGVVNRPGLSGRLGGPARVTVLAAPPGSGKTVLLRSWISGAGLAGRAAWVAAGRDEHDPQRFWLSVLNALRATSAGSELVRALTAAPDLDGWAMVERLLTDLALLAEPLWLVIDDLHELGSDQARRQLELLMLRAPHELRFVLASRHDLRLGLHRLRLAGDLAEIRADDLRFSPAEARELFAAAGVELPGPALELLYDRTEGWAAGLRLAALSLAGRDDPARFAAEFSGSDRTVAEYLLAEVLDRQGEQVRRLLLRTSILERVNGELADLLAGGHGGERVLHDLEEANAFVVSLDADRSWFRYHHLFADLLRLQLRYSEPEQVTALHQRAAGWLAEHGYPVEAIRHAQAAQDWKLAAQLLAGHWPALHLDGHDATVHALLAGFPAGAPAAHPEVAAVAASDELTQGSVAAAERFLGLAEQGPAPARGGRAQVLLGMVRLRLAWHQGDFAAVPEQARQLLALADAPDASQAGLGDDLRALTLISLGDVETWTGRPDQAHAHLAEAGALARRIGRPYLEFQALMHQAQIDLSGRVPRAEERGRQAFALAERHGWTEGSPVALTCMTVGSALTWQGQLNEAAAWLRRADRSFSAAAAPLVAMGITYVRGQLELGRGRAAEALAAFQAAERYAGRLGAPHPLSRPLRAWLAHALVRLGEIGRAEQVLTGLSDRDRERPEMRIAAAVLRLAQGDPHGATTALGPAVDGSARKGWRSWLVEAFLLEAIARDELGEPAAAGRAMTAALELAEPDRALLWFLLHPAPGLLERNARPGSPHAALIAEILDLVAPARPASPVAQPSLEPLSTSELRVLRYLPTHLTAPEIAAELSVSTSTVKTHMRNLYAKLGAHRRAEVVETARAQHLLAPPARSR
jgi:LuxR family transcriptional regulator, maltose regulon positive regulatory protein